MLPKTKKYLAKIFDVFQIYRKILDSLKNLSITSFWTNLINIEFLCKNFSKISISSSLFFLKFKISASSPTTKSPKIKNTLDFAKISNQKPNSMLIKFANLAKPVFIMEKS